MSRFLRKYQAVSLPTLFYLGGETILMDGAETIPALPSDCEIIHVDTRGQGSFYLEINGSAHNAWARIYMPTDTHREIGPIANPSGQNWLSVLGDAGTYVHLTYYRRA